MAFRLPDFKKTSRSANGTRQIYPHQLRDDRFLASIGFAIEYYERNIGRKRSEFEADTLLEFFGDPRLARGIVACLGHSYVWRAPTLEETLGAPLTHTLRKAGLATPADFRARLYGLANGRYSGVILPEERAEALEYLCARISGAEDVTEDERRTTDDGRQKTEDGRRASDHDQGSLVIRHSSLVDHATLTPTHFEQVLTLDAEEQRLLTKIGATPTAREIVARYNHHSLDTALRHAEWLKIQLSGAVWEIVRSAHNLARRYRLRYSIGDLPRTLFDETIELTLYGGRDALGGWTRTGKRLSRALLRLLAAHPGAQIAGEARVQIGGPALLRLDDRAFKAFGAVAAELAGEAEAWEADVADQFQAGWSKAQTGGRTAGWRLRRDPEPLVGTSCVVVPDFIALSQQRRVAVCLALGRAAGVALLRDLGQLGGPAVVVAPEVVASGLARGRVPVLAYTNDPAEAIPRIAALLAKPASLAA